MIFYWRETCWFREPATPWSASENRTPVCGQSPVMERWKSLLFWVTNTVGLTYHSNNTGYNSLLDILYFIFCFSGYFSDPSERTRIVTAMKDLESQTCLRFVPRVAQRGYLSIEPRYGWVCNLSTHCRHVNKLLCFIDLYTVADMTAGGQYYTCDNFICKICFCWR